MASRDDDKAMAGMIQRSLAHDAAEPGNCPAPEILAAYYERSLDGDEAARCELHFSRCARCREQLAAIVRAEEKPHLQPKAIWLLSGRWLVPAAAVLLLAVVWVARRPTQHKAAEQTSNTPLVAMSKPVSAPHTEAVVGSEALPSVPSSMPGAAKPAPSEAARLSVEKVPSAATQSRNAVDEFSRARKSVETSAVGAAGIVRGVASGEAPEAKPLAKKNAPSLPAPRVALVPRAAAPPSPSEQYSAAGRTEVTAEARSAQLPHEGKQVLASNQAQASAAPEAAPAQRAGTQMMEVMPSKKVAKAMAINGNSSTARGDANLVVLDRSSSTSIVKTPDPAVLWRIVGEGFIERSEDSGATWKGQVPYANAHLLAGAAPAAKTCWLVGRDGMIVLTRDGKHWKKIEPPAPVDLVAVTAADASAAVVTTVDGRTFATSNAGKTWGPVQ